MWCIIIKKDVKRYVITLKNTSWHQTVHHRVKKYVITSSGRSLRIRHYLQRNKVRHNTQKYVIMSKGVIKSKSISKCKQVFQDVKSMENTS